MFSNCDSQAASAPLTEPHNLVPITRHKVKPNSAFIVLGSQVGHAHASQLALFAATASEEDADQPPGIVRIAKDCSRTTV